MAAKVLKQLIALGKELGYEGEALQTFLKDEREAAAERVQLKSGRQYGQKRLEKGKLLYGEKWLQLQRRLQNGKEPDGQKNEKKERRNENVGQLNWKQK